MKSGDGETKVAGTTVGSKWQVVTERKRFPPTGMTRM